MRNVNADPQLMTMRKGYSDLPRERLDQGGLIHDARLYPLVLPGKSRLQLLLSGLCQNHGETWGHVCRVAYWTGVLGRECGWKESSLLQLRIAALLHDIGKITIPKRILQKPGKLSTTEFSIAKLHCLEGANLLSQFKLPFFVLAREIALCHHECWDGTGYPFGLQNSSIPFGARIVAVADHYDALRSDRPYRPALAEVDVRAILKSERGSKLDPALVDTFIDSLLRKSRSVFVLKSA